MPNILPSERAFAYKMKWEAIRKQGQRTDLTLSQVATKYRSDERIANEFGIGKDTLHRYIRLTYLIHELLERVDEGKIALTPAVELSYLTNEEQQALLNEIEYADATRLFHRRRGSELFHGKADSMPMSSML